METKQHKLIFIVIGPSGSGKTSFCREAVLDLKQRVMFLSTGDELRKREIICPWQEPDMPTVKLFCHEVINKTLEAFKVSTTHAVLILDCVKDLADAEYISSLTKKYDLEITRALLMNINPEELEKRWKGRGEPRDLLRRGSGTSYFHKWMKKFNDVFNYYKKMKILSLNDSYCYQLSDILYFKDTSSKIMNEYPAIPCSNRIYFQLIDSVKVRNILEFLLSFLEITRFPFALPASFVNTNDDVTWVANPTRYHVTPKSDGVRFLLVKIHDECYLINRKNEIYPCRIESSNIPNKTVLDGELLPSTTFSDIHPKTTTSLKTNVFLTFDVLAVSGQILWKWPFSERKEALSNLPINKDIEAVMKEASSDGVVATETKPEAAPKEDCDAGKLAVLVSIKEHYKSTCNAILACLSSSKNVPYPCDGLVFTPDTPYTIGPDPLLFKWQPEGLAHCDIACKDLQSGKRCCVNNLALNRFLSNNEKGRPAEHQLFGRIMECQWNKKTSAWDPLFLRHDKPAPNSDETIDRIENVCRHPYTESQLVTRLTRIIDDDKLKEDEKLHPITKCFHLIHPTMSYSFDELYSLVNELVQFNEVEKVIDSITNLEIFNYHGSSSHSNPIVQLCRGLVLHPESKTVVTKPFVRFFEDVDVPDPLEIVEATVKFDGSLGIAFQWNNEVNVTTRRRMDSEQAIWAKQWIQDHCNASVFQAGCTYLFEIVCKVNTVVVKYPFQGLVLLAVTDENGHELPYDDVMCLGRTAGFFMVTPRITGSYSDIAWYCGGIPSNGDLDIQHPSSSCIFSALPMCSKQQEGWVVKFNDGKRQKIVHNWWKRASKVVHLVHPQIVWLLLKHNQIGNVFRNIPNDIRKEIQSMMKAIARLFFQTLKLLRQSLAGSNSKSKTESKARLMKSRSYGNVMLSDSEESSDDSERFEQLISDEDSFNLKELFENLVLETVDDHDSAEYYDDDVQRSDDNASDDEERLQTLRIQTTELYRRKLRSKRLERHFSPFYRKHKQNLLREAVLDYIRPTEPVIKGYEPSENFKQTWSKGWKTLPNDERKLVQQILQEDRQYPPLLQMPTEVILLFLDFLDGRSLAALGMVCWKLWKIAQSRQSLRRKIDEARSHHEDTLARWEAAESRSSYKYDDYHESHDFHSGYGSDGNYF